MDNVLDVLNMVFQITEAGHVENTIYDNDETVFIHLDKIQSVNLLLQNVT